MSKKGSAGRDGAGSDGKGDKKSKVGKKGRAKQPAAKKAAVKGDAAVPPAAATGTGAADADEGLKNEFRKKLVQSLLALPLLDEMGRVKQSKQDRLIDVTIDLNLLYAESAMASTLDAARKPTIDLVGEICQSYPHPGEASRQAGVSEAKSLFAYQHVFASLSVRQIEELARRIEQINPFSKRSIYKIWLDAEIEGHLLKSIQTIKADASINSFGANGEGICWAVLDSGIDKDHKHFKKFANLEVLESLRHLDFTGEQVDFSDAKFDLGLVDENGHGTHVAGIVGGEFDSEWSDGDGKPSGEATVVYRNRDEQNEEKAWPGKITAIRGVAPRCKLLSLRVLDKDGRGKESNILAALGYIDKINSSARWPKIHGVNLSVGYEFKAEWFACGQSPLCVEVDRLVRTGIPVVTAAGNTGYGKIRLENGSTFRTGIPLTINDPGNAANAITVGSTHREHPHTYGVSYFSSKGPTGDGRLKPDLIAPGERIVSCAAGVKGGEAAGQASLSECDYREESGTSMAAPHVSGALAAFLSIRREFIGQPERLKEVLLATCTDLGRERYFQGHGLLDLMRAIQSV